MLVAMKGWSLGKICFSSSWKVLFPLIRRLRMISGYTDCRQAQHGSEKPGTERLACCRLCFLSSKAWLIPCFAFSSLSLLLVNESKQKVPGSWHVFPLPLQCGSNVYVYLGIAFCHIFSRNYDPHWTCDLGTANTMLEAQFWCENPAHRPNTCQNRNRDLVHPGSSP